MSTFNKESHPCQYCDKPCYGKQCKDCHNSMIAKQSGQCTDCNETFRALRQDGTMRKRCLKCQEEYTKSFISVCSCGTEYHNKTKDGRAFDKCFNCYNAQFKKCAKCDNKTLSKYSLCKECNDKKIKTEMRKCISCVKMTLFTYCKECNNSNREMKNMYMMSVCQSKGCSERYRGDYKFCETHA